MVIDKVYIAQTLGNVYYPFPGIKSYY
ncbi:uncharacterized protein METZ01_LOCUS156658 [marine metagenome]|uniref:Uncharacterized protein n=1 Tax=marine metagenome TaxID=408172 RepID=A0A382AQZ9_9ZZZZ